MKRFPHIKLGVVNAEEVQEIAGFLMAFTAPVLVLYIDGKEVLREARIVHLDQFHVKLERIFMHYHDMNDRG